MFLFQHKHLCLLMNSRRKPPSGLHVCGRQCAQAPIPALLAAPSAPSTSQQVLQASQPLWRKQTWGHDLLHCNKQVLMEPPVNSQCFLGSNSAEGRRQEDMEQRNQIKRIKRTEVIFYEFLSELSSFWCYLWSLKSALLPSRGGVHRQEGGKCI